MGKFDYAVSIDEMAAKMEAAAKEEIERRVALGESREYAAERVAREIQFFGELMAGREM